ncbi:MAG TPA: methionine adenosyltransferase [Chloroflexota bacterium]|nr:methionine adenosyltransferase [Chloroflexota bacterium]
MYYRLFTSESVAAGHPDKVCDQISDAIVDAVYAQDPFGRVAVEALTTKNQVVLAGEVTTKAEVDFATVAREVIRSLGYTNNSFEFDDRSDVIVRIHQQSPEIAAGVDSGGAGDQGMMFGYAVRETPELMPLPIALAHRLTEAMDQARISGVLPFLRPDGKSQVTVEYDGLRPIEVTKVVLAVPHDPSLSNDDLTSALFEMVVIPTLGAYGYQVNRSNLIVNGTGVWHAGGPASDTGLTGRKIVVDGYGGMARVGGGAFSGKDPTKVDRSGAYAARYLAKNIVSSGLAERCEVQLAYVIGHPSPIARAVETFGSATVGLDEIERHAWQLLDLSVKGIIAGLNLRQPIYRRTAAYGHFGRDGFPWEQVAIREGVSREGVSNGALS